MRNVNIGKLRTLPSGGEGFILTMRNVNHKLRHSAATMYLVLY